MQRRGLVSLSNKRGADYSMAQLAQTMDAASLDLLRSQVLQAAIYEKPVYLDSKAGIVEYYQEKYGPDSRGKNGWKATLVRDLIAQGVSKDAARKSLQPSRINQPGGRSEHWKKLGATLPPSGYIPTAHDLTGRQASVSADISFVISETYKDAHFDKVLSPGQTAALLGEGDFTAALAAYGLPTGNISDFQITSLSIDLL